ncbi:hypothetical protein KC842_00790 [Candidatus Nomurabacteria bacterium]|nr:hypothetical protein [Candidatus Nomurabacteria bacterium]USN95019.1 MAG: hypothetical protein H6791_01140 [Candidatus Nomurabacteria bacterium]
MNEELRCIARAVSRVQIPDFLEVKAETVIDHNERKVVVKVTQKAS